MVIIVYLPFFLAFVWVFSKLNEIIDACFDEGSHIVNALFFFSFLIERMKPFQGKTLILYPLKAP